MGHKNNWVGYIFLLPFLLVYTLLVIYPTIQGASLGFMARDLSGFSEFVGWENFEELIFFDERFWLAMKNTIVFALICTPLMIGLSLGIALVVQKDGAFRSFLRGIFFVTSVLSITVGTLIWILLFRSEFGLVPSLLSDLGFGSIVFFENKMLAMPTIISMTMWWGIGFPMLLFVAALRQIPKERIEAAKLDGANAFQLYWSIIRPEIKYVMLLNLILQMIAQLQVFGQVQLLTGGGPDDSTLSLVMYLYTTAWGDWRLGYASAISIALFFVMLLPITAQLVLEWRKKD